MEKIFDLKTVTQYNTAFRTETLHPLVSVIDLSKSYPDNSEEYTRIRMGFYSVSLKGSNCGHIKYGRFNYDYQEGTLVCTAPGQILTLDDTEEIQEPYNGLNLVFHPDILHGTNLGRNIKNYGFFSYEVNEALHLSEHEKKTIIECFRNVEHELKRGMDTHSKNLIVSNIELLLNYCNRFYERQFITRSHVNTDVLSRFEKILDQYFLSDMPQIQGLPSVAYCAEQLNLSKNYLSDMLRKHTGKSALEHIQLKVIELAKEKMYEKEKTVSQIAFELGFEYPQYFSKLFKQKVGVTPLSYRNLN
jgi:AraC-like DNA-binding protein